MPDATDLEGSSNLAKSRSVLLIVLVDPTMQCESALDTSRVFVAKLED